MFVGSSSKFGAGAVVVFMPPLLSIILFGKSRGIEAAFQLGVNISFALIALMVIGAFIVFCHKMICIYIEAKNSKD